MNRFRGMTTAKILLIVGGAVAGFLVLVVVVVGVILYPMLSKARERAKMVVCASHMRQTGQLMEVFQVEHDNRGPGGAVESGGARIYPLEIMDREVLGGATPRSYSSSGGTSKMSLNCPNFVPSARYAGQQMGYNLDASGGDDGSHLCGPYGVKLDNLAMVGASYAAYGPPSGQYWLGAKVSRFTPNQFLMIEQESPDPLTKGGGGDARGRVTLGGDATFPVYATAKGTFSFRHPYSKGANFLYFDGHVDHLDVTDDVASSGHFDLPK